MILWLQIYKKKLGLISLILILSLWAITSSLKILLTQDKVMVVHMTDRGAKVLSNMDSKRLDFEAENFLNYFVGHFYAFHSLNFESRIETSLQLMSIELAKIYVPKLNSMYEKTQAHRVEQFAYIKKIDRIKTGEYELLIAVNRRTGIEDMNTQYKLKVSIEETSRSIENPYGYLITEIKEEHV